LENPAREVIGLPIRPELVRTALETKREFSGSVFRILVVGGSQGAKRLNRAVLEAFSLLSPEEKKKIAVMHITGKSDFEETARAYQTMDMNAQTFPFYDRMQQLYADCDLAITRAGANTLFELALFRLPAIVIPYPFAGGHQKENAQVFARSGAVVMQEESALNGEWLCKQIRALESDRPLRVQMSGELDKLSSPDAADRLVVLAERFLKTEKTWQLSTRI
ncbi:MAG TPA: glycosyltransferase, partial [bacterium]|nr:glycosyltransferase [bacterium]